MLCTCGAETGVKDSRPTKVLAFNSIRRRRRCLTCDKTFTTYELADDKLLEIAMGLRNVQELMDALQTIANIGARIQAQLHQNGRRLQLIGKADNE